MSKTRYIKDGYTGQTPLQFCPVCFHKLDGVSNMQSKHKPVPGDFTICIECANILKFSGEMALELSSLEAIPIHSRMAFANVVTVLKAMGRPVKPSVFQ